METTGLGPAVVAGVHGISLDSQIAFEQVELFDTGMPMGAPTLKFKLGIALEQLKCSIEVKGPRMGLLEMRKHLTHYLKGFEGARDMRQRLLTSDNAEWVVQALTEIYESLSEDSLTPALV